MELIQVHVWIKCRCCAAHKKKFSVKDFFSKCDQIRKKLWIWLHLLKKFLTESFIYENLWQLL